MESPSSPPPTRSARLFLSLITCYSVRQQLFDNLTPYSIACLLHIFKVQLGNEVGTVEKQRFLNPIRCLFDRFEMEEIEEGIKKGHAIIIWGKDLQVMTWLLQNPEPEMHESWPQEINLGINDFKLSGSCPKGEKCLPGHWLPALLEGGQKTFIKVTTPELGIRLHHMYFAIPRTWTGARSTLWTPNYDWNGYVSEKRMAQYTLLEMDEESSSPAYSMLYINVHESSSIVKRMKNPVFVVDYRGVYLSYMSFEVEGLDTASPILEDTLEMRRAWLEGKEAYLQIDG